MHAKTKLALKISLISHLIVQQKNIEHFQKSANPRG